VKTLLHFTIKTTLTPLEKYTILLDFKKLKENSIKKIKRF